MSLYSLCAIGSVGLGPVAAGWIEMNPRLQWRWIQWIHMMYVDMFIVIMHTLTHMQPYGSHLSLDNRRYEGNPFHHYSDAGGKEVTEGHRESSVSRPSGRRDRQCMDAALYLLH